MCAKILKRYCLCLILITGLDAQARGAPPPPPTQLAPEPTMDAAAGDSLQPIPGQAVRIWNDAKRTRQALALLLAANEHRARLRKSDGTVVTISLDQLSLEDQQFIRTALQPAGSGRNPFTVVPAEPNRAELQRDIDKKLVVPDSAEFKLREVVPPRGNEESAPPLVPQPIPGNMVYVRISHSFLNRFVAREVNREDPVNDVILGRPVSGTSHTQGRVELALVPSAQGAHAELQFRGTTRSNTIAYDRVVQVYSAAITQIDTRKSVRVDEQGTSLFPAQTNASTSSTTTGIATDLPRLRGRIAVCIATRSVEAKRDQVDMISSQHNSVRISHQFDQTVNNQVQQLKERTKARVAQLRADHSLPQVGFRFSSTADALQIVVLRPAGTGQQFVDPPLAAVERPDIEVHVHAALVHRIMNDSDFRTRLRPLLDLLPNLGSGTLSMAAGTDTPMYGTRWSDDQNWLTLMWDADGEPNFSPRPATREELSADWDPSGEHSS